ncbi:MAG TPA: hypothetical protein VH302_07705 [Bryobacteraceae bacterium]|nr:hypothetical protein [Bryobacteraceae bacterium]
MKLLAIGLDVVAIGLGIMAVVYTMHAQTRSEAQPWMDVEFPRDSPVLAVSTAFGPSAVHPRGASMAIDLHASLLLRNTGNKTISGLTLRIEAQDLTPSGKASVTVPSLAVPPGEVFPVRVDAQLVRPFSVGRAEGALVQVSLDCALFGDLTAYGPDKLNSRRALMVYELEARRDRRYMATLLKDKDWARVREELDFGLQDLHPQQIGLELLHDPRANTWREQAVNVAAVTFPKAPVQPLSGAARVAGNEVHAPAIQIKNMSQKTVQIVDMGWIVLDDRGREFIAGSIPAALNLAPVAIGTMTEGGTLRFSHPEGSPMMIGALKAFVSDVEFADGKLWIPSRTDIDEATTDPLLRRALATSPEQQRLAEIYRRKGITGLVEELRKLN